MYWHSFWIGQNAGQFSRRSSEGALCRHSLASCGRRDNIDHTILPDYNYLASCALIAEVCGVLRERLKAFLQMAPSKRARKAEWCLNPILGIIRSGWW
jgi:hypothetical protein